MVKTTYKSMGTWVAPSRANIFMAKFKETNLPKHMKQPMIFKRYIDDCLAIFSGTEEEFKSWIKFLNSCHSFIKFTFEHYGQSPKSTIL